MDEFLTDPVSADQARPMSPRAMRSATSDAGSPLAALSA